MDFSTLKASELEGLKYIAELRKYCIEISIYSLGAMNAEETIRASKELEKYILETNGEASNTNQIPDYEE